MRAQSLMGGLASEKIRWTETYQSLSSTYDNLVGDALVSAGSIGKSALTTPIFPSSKTHVFRDIQMSYSPFLHSVEICHGFCSAWSSLSYYFRISSHLSFLLLAPHCFFILHKSFMLSS